MRLSSWRCSMRYCSLLMIRLRSSSLFVHFTQFTNYMLHQLQAHSRLLVARSSIAWNFLQALHRIVHAMIRKTRQRAHEGLDQEEGRCTKTGIIDQTLMVNAKGYHVSSSSIIILKRLFQSLLSNHSHALVPLQVTSKSSFSQSARARLLPNPI